MKSFPSASLVLALAAVLAGCGGGGGGGKSPSGAAPEITTQPLPATSDVGGSASFTVVVKGSGSTFQWYKDGAAITGAKYATHTVARVTLADAGTYSVRVTRGGKNVTSDGALLKIAAVPTIVAQPTDATAVLGSPASFSVQATGVGPLSYQWTKDGAAIVGATGTTYTIPTASVGDAGGYAVRVTNPKGTTTSRVATLTILVPPTIAAQPAPQTVNVGDTARFSVVAEGNAPLAYQWTKDGVPIPGATSVVFTIPSVNLGDAGGYAVVVSNALGRVTSDVAALTVTNLPRIASQPRSTSADDGRPASFSVSATGENPLAYQWTKNGSPISGATDATYTIPSVAPGDAGGYAVVVSNAQGRVTSDVAVLTVTNLLTITSQPRSVNGFTGSPDTFSVSATGRGPLSYQWTKDGTEIPGATDATYSIFSVATGDAGTYRVVVTNPSGSVTSGAATLTVTVPMPPAITRQPYRLPRSGSVGVIVSGSAPLTYQWFRDGVAAGTSPIVPYGGPGLYKVVVTNVFGSATGEANL